MRWRFRFAPALALGCLVACGNSESPEVPNEPNGGGGGTSGTSSGGAGTSSGTGGSAAVCQGELDFAERMSADGTCGGVTCPELPDSADPRYDYRRHCCTDEGACGVGSGALFGGACFERNQEGTPSDECPYGSVYIYYDFGSEIVVADGFPGCCRPDGQCGLDTSRTFGAGCVERSELGAAVLDECNGFDEPLEVFESIPCTPP